MQCQCLFKPVNVSSPVVWWWSRAPVKHLISPHTSLFSVTICRRTVVFGAVIYSLGNIVIFIFLLSSSLLLHLHHTFLLFSSALPLVCCLPLSSPQVIRGESLDSPSPSILQSSRQPSYRSEPSSLDGATVVGGGVGARRGGGERGEGPGGPSGTAVGLSGGMTGYSLTGRSYTSYPSSLVLSTGGSRSSSLRSAHTAHNPLATLQSEGTTDTSYKSLANQTPRNGSLSYDSLLTPSESPEFESAAHELSPQKPHALSPSATITGQPEVMSPSTRLQGYTSPFLSAQIAQQREGQLLQGSATFSSPHRAYLRAVSPPPPSSGPPEIQHLLHHNQDSSSRATRNPSSSSSSPGVRSLEPPVSPPPRGLSLGKSQSYTGEAGQQHKPRPAGGSTVLGGGGAGGGQQAPQWVVILLQIRQPATLPPCSPFPPKPLLLPPWFVSALLFLPDLCESSFSSFLDYSQSLLVKCSTVWMEVVGSPGGMSALVIRACQYMFSCDCMFNHAAIYFCPVALSFLYSLSLVTECLTISMVEKHFCVCACLLLFFK